MITEDYVSFEIAKLLKEKGFDWECYGYYDTTKHPDYMLEHSGSEIDSNDGPDCYISAPTLQMAMKWLREMHYLHITAHPGVSRYGFVWTYTIVFAKEVGEGETHSYKINQITTPIVKSKSCEQACEAAVKYCLEHLI